MIDRGPKRIMAVTSGGGHWEQMMMLRDAFAGEQVTFVTTMQGLGARTGLPNVHTVQDCNRNEPWRAIACGLSILWLCLRVRPDVIISTGALPGVIALALGRKLGIRTVWVDSIANAEELSMAGQRAKTHADLWLTQWPFVAEKTGAQYYGSVL